MPEYSTPRFMDSSITVDDVAAHLRLYSLVRSHLFELASEHVYYDEEDFLRPTQPTGKLYLRRIVYRFSLWLERVLRPRFQKMGAGVGIEAIELPPYDVLLVLHAFMLHPRAFYSDTIRLRPELSVLNGFPLDQMLATINESSRYDPKLEQISLWEAATGELFSPPLTTLPSDTFELTCPSCEYSFKAEWLSDSDDGKGTNLAAKCKNCNMLITEDAFGAKLMLQDIRRAKSGEGVGLAGTVLGTDGALDAAKSRKITIDIARELNLYDIENVHISNVVKILQDIQVDRRNIRPEVESILDLYGLPGGFSFDLGAAVLRQTGFASKMYHNGWTNPMFPQVSSSVIEESISRYAGFLELTMEKGARALGPAHDIDLVWHTHQLKANYRLDLLRIFNWFLDHVDFAPVQVLATSYENGGNRWQDKYGTPYHDYFLNATFPRPTIV